MSALVLRTKEIIGRKERIHFADYGLKGMIAKIDTGAYRSALHCHILGTSHIDGTDYVSFIPLVYKNKVKNSKPILIPITRIIKVKSSTGHMEERYVITMNVQLNGHSFNTEFSLTDRSSMRHTILLGRKFLKKGRFIVDVSKLFVLSKKKKK